MMRTAPGLNGEQKPCSALASLCRPRACLVGWGSFLGHPASLRLMPQVTIFPPCAYCDSR